MREYEAFVTRDLAQIAETAYGTATELARLPEIIRDFGYVKVGNVELYRRRQVELLELLETLRGSILMRPECRVFDLAVHLAIRQMQAVLTGPHV